tara:strand:+ start:243 stop:1184 length:942 start_codon:yes stop_codon:yes gene_type:complete
MNKKNHSHTIYLEKLKKLVPKNLIIEEVNEDKKELVNQFLKSRKDLGFTFDELTPHFGKNWDYNKYPYGNIMRETNSKKIVGFMATIYSQRIVEGRHYLCCNLAHFYVEKEFRMFAYFFFLYLLERNKIVIYSHTPKDTIMNIYRKLNFEIQIMKYTISLGLNIKSIFSKNFKRFKIINNKQDIENILDEKDKKIYDDHRKYNCLHFVVIDEKKILKPCYFVGKRIKKFQIQLIDILYTSNFAQYKDFAPEIFTKVSLFYKSFLVGQRYFKESEKFENNFSFFSKTVEKFVPIKKYNNFYVFDTLYSDHVLFT